MTQSHSVEALLEAIDGVPEGSANIDLWVPVEVTMRGQTVSSDVVMAVVLDRLLARGFMPAGFTRGVNGRTYHYRREISN